MDQSRINKAGIIGLGLIGGSLAKALKQKLNVKTIVAYNRNQRSLDQALADGIIDICAYEIDERFRGCDIVFVCTPVGVLPSIVRKIADIVGNNCIITDVGSTKKNIMEQLGDYPNFIGGHPMAGSEKSGYLSSNVALFENAFYILSPNRNTESSQIELLKNTVVAMGGIPVIIDADKHDHAVAGISHLPHIIASSLVNMIAVSDDEKKHMHLLAAGGFKDITRIASSDPLMWQNICSDNHEEILNLMQAFKAELARFEYELKGTNKENMIGLFESAKEYRDSFSKTILNPYYAAYQLYVDIVDKPGSIATIATLLSVNNINIKNIGIINNREHQSGVLQIIFQNKAEMNRSKTLLVSMNYIVYPAEA